MHGASGPATPVPVTPVRPAPATATPSWRLLAVLGVGGALAGGLIVTAFLATVERITEHKAALVVGAVREVLKAGAGWDTLYLVEGKLTKQAPTGPGAQSAERVFVGYDAADQTLGAAITAGEPGFADVVSLIFGLAPATGALLGVKVLGHKETPGLGDKIERPTFLQQFVGALTPLKGVKTKGADKSEVQTITGATITSRTVIRIVNNATARWQPLLQAYRQEGSR